MLRTFLVLLLLPGTAAAQVSTDDHALDQLQTAPAKPPLKPGPKPVPKPVTHHTTHTSSHASPAKSAAKQVPAKPPPPLPQAPPAHPVIAPPPFVMPVHPPPPPPPVPVKADAAGVVTPMPGGITRVTFGPGVSDLNPATAAAIKQIAAEAVAKPAELITIDAWAAGTPEDPSTPRRISLDRALAARAVLINAGVVSERIHAVAKGFSEIGDGPADRIDIGVK